jgi:hypothetical protein
MNRGLEMLKAGRAAIEKENGETYTIGGVSCVGTREDRERTDPLNGTVRETVISVPREKFATLPSVGSIVTDGTDSWRVADARPGATGAIKIYCIGNV